MIQEAKVAVVRALRSRQLQSLLSERELEENFKFFFLLAHAFADSLLFLLDATLQLREFDNWLGRAIVYATDDGSLQEK